MPKALIVSNGKISDYSYYTSKVNSDDFIICADGGIKHLLKLNLTPDLWIGDFDSCKFDDIISENPHLKSVPTVKLRPDKDVTDTHYACTEAINRGYSQILIWGACGGRYDHMISNIHLLEYLNEKGIFSVIEDEKNTICVCCDSITVTKKRKYLSILPLTDTVVIAESSGLLYPLNDFSMSRSVSVGVSNEITGEKATIAVKTGLALIVESDD